MVKDFTLGMRTQVWTGLLLAFLARPGLTASCDDPGTQRTYRDPSYGVSFSYPSSLTLVPGSDGVGTARFVTADGLVSATITFLPNNRRERIAELYQEARRDIVENGRGSITHHSANDNWFVVIGSVANRAFYQRTLVIRQNSIIANLWVEFPPELRSCTNSPVTRMARSFS
jgi:hypothetical protein